MLLFIMFANHKKGGIIMTANIINTSGIYVDGKKVIEAEKEPIASRGSLDLLSGIILVGCGVFKASVGVMCTVGCIATKKEPRSPHMIIFDSMEGRL